MMKKNKILWFSLSPCGSIRRKLTKKTNQGWLISLEDELKKIDSIDLNVAFFSAKEKEPFEYEGVHYFPIYESSSQSFFSRFKSVDTIDSKRLPLMLSVIERCNPDLIHIHGTEGSFGCILPYIKNIPIVISIQGLIAPISEKYFSGLSMEQIKRHESLKLKLSTLGVDRFYKNFSNRGVRECAYLTNARYVFGRTAFDRNVCMALNPCIKYQVVNEMMRPEFYLHNWLEEHNTCSDEVILVTVMSPNAPYKGYETLLKAAKILKENSCLNFIWNLIGYNEDNKWLVITEKIVKISHRDVNVRIIGNKTASEMIEVLLSSDMYVNVSHIENSSNSVCEAMLLGMPIIASYAGGTSSLLTHEKEGVLIQDGGSYELAGTIIDFIQNPLVAAQYAHAARKRAQERHNKEKILKEIMDGYTNILRDFGKCTH